MFHLGQKQLKCISRAWGSKEWPWCAVQSVSEQQEGWGYNPLPSENLSINYSCFLPIVVSPYLRFCCCRFNSPRLLIREFGMDMYTLLCLKCIVNKDLLYSTWNSAQHYVAAWMGEEFGGEWIQVCVWLSPFAVHLNHHDIVNGLPWKWKSLSRVWLSATPWTIQSMKFSRPEYWNGYPFLSPGDLPNPGITTRFPHCRWIFFLLSLQLMGYTPIQNKML